MVSFMNFEVVVGLVRKLRLQISSKTNPLKSAAFSFPFFLWFFFFLFSVKFGIEFLVLMVIYLYKVRNCTGAHIKFMLAFLFSNTMYSDQF